MATKLGNWVWEGVSTEAKPVQPEAQNGHIFKELDTGESYTMVAGDWIYINLGLAFVKATKSGRVTTDAGGESVVTFNTPFIDNVYSIVLSVKDDGGKTPTASMIDRTPEGFKIITRNSTSGQKEGGVIVSWLATRDYNP
jgi:hypothetical protein